MIRWPVVLALLAAPPFATAAQAPERPRPYPVPETQAFARAVERGTRTRTGDPGPRYWQQWSRYRLEATLDPATARLTGRGSVRYFNRSPDTLRFVLVHLFQNVFAPNAVRNEEVPVTTGMELVRVAAQGHELLGEEGTATTPGVAQDATLMRVTLPRPLAPGDSTDLEFAWAFTVPEQGPRMGRDSAVFYLAYWYPQVAVYDDVWGWHRYPHMGTAEFYMGYGDYEVALTVPAGWLVAATGTLENAADVLTAEVRQRLAGARRARDVIHVVTEADRAAGRATARGAGGSLTWRFRATNVRDFAWGASDKYVWDATHAAVGDATGDGRPDTSAIHTFYRPGARTWDQSARYARHSVEFLSRYLWPYPYPHMTAVDGIQSCGGMEYPMMTCIGGSRDTLRLYSVTVHEIGHMWFPMQVGSNEQAYAWQDEGLTRFNQAQGMREFFNGLDNESSSRQQYLGFARSGNEVELMRHGEQYPYGSAAYGIASYEKMATILVMLRALLGDEAFLKAYREYGRRWVNKHPTPYDFWHTFSEVAGRDLWWFWRTWFFETWTLDQAISVVRPTHGGDSLEIVVEDRGLAPMPVALAVTRANGRVERYTVPVEVWLAGARRHAVRVADGASVTRVEIDPEVRFADTDRANQVWTR